MTIAITSPNADQIDTTDDVMNISGTANSDAGVSTVSWSSDKGQTGTASGTSSWTVDQVPLELGANTITVTATDAAGDSRSDTIVINRESTGTGSTTLSWEAPTQRTDGTALTDLAGYTIHYGRMSGVYDYQIDINTPGVATYVVENLVPGDWYFSLSAYDSSGLESDLSNEAHRQIQ
ncbi:MAG TPA: Ig-like domain-containing protein [Woeseiaceae bacterium]|nr:Ig-like domain-containing protein [Woeseiaceae bacterium]